MTYFHRKNKLIVTVDMIRSKMHLPQPEAAKELGICLSTLKKRFYKYFPNERWPSNAQRKSMENVKTRMKTIIEEKARLSFILNEQHEDEKMIPAECSNYLRNLSIETNGYPGEQSHSLKQDTMHLQSMQAPMKINLNQAQQQQQHMMYNTNTYMKQPNLYYTMGQQPIHAQQHHHQQHLHAAAAGAPPPQQQQQQMHQAPPQGHAANTNAQNAHHMTHMQHMQTFQNAPHHHHAMVPGNMMPSYMPAQPPMGHYVQYHYAHVVPSKGQDPHVYMGSPQQTQQQPPPQQQPQQQMHAYMYPQKAVKGSPYLVPMGNHTTY